MNPRDLSAQIASVRHLLNFSESDETRACAEQAIKSLEWMSKGELVLKELMRLRKEEPELFQALSNIIGSGAKLSSVRDIQSERIGL